MKGIKFHRQILNWNTKSSESDWCFCLSNVCYLGMSDLDEVGGMQVLSSLWKIRHFVYAEGNTKNKRYRESMECIIREPWQWNPRHFLLIFEYILCNRSNYVSLLQTSDLITNIIKSDMSSDGVWFQISLYIIISYYTLRQIWEYRVKPDLHRIISDCIELNLIIQC